jgi:hypothetical protein
MAGGLEAGQEEDAELAPQALTGHSLAGERVLSPQAAVEMGLGGWKPPLWKSSTPWAVGSTYDGAEQL